MKRGVSFVFVLFLILLTLGIISAVENNSVVKCVGCIDVDNNGGVNAGDVLFIRNFSGKCSGNEGYDVKYDINANGCIDENDAECARNNLGKLLSCSCVKCTDIDGNGGVNLGDALILRQKVGFCKGDIDYIESYDINSNGCVGLDDFECVRKDIGKITSCNSNLSNSCTDSDGGIGYYVKGQTKEVGDCTNNVCTGIDDMCKSSTILLEGYCDDNKKVSSKEYTCPYGCSDGACLKESKCGDKICTEDEKRIICPSCPVGQVCTQGCKMVCPEDCETTTCTDSDGGKNYYKSGSCKSLNKEIVDACIIGGTYDGELREAYCDSSNECLFIPFKCPNGCKDGACVGVIERKCTSDKECVSSCTCIAGEVCKCSEAKCINGECKFEEVHNACNSDSDCPTLNCIKAPCPTYKCIKGVFGGICKVVNEEDLIKEQITCKFENSNNEEQCYLAGQWGPDDLGTKYCKADSGAGSCVISYSGYKGEKVTWKSTCGQYQTTKQDGIDEVIYFKCGEGETNVSVIKNIGFRYAYWQCYDKYEEKQGSESLCKPSEVWQEYAKKACDGHCYKDNSKCGVNSFGVSEECYTNENIPIQKCNPLEEDVQECCSRWAKENSIIIPTCVGGWNIEYDKCYYSCKDGEEIIPKEVLVCKDSCPLDNKCFNFGYRKSGKYCSDSGSFEDYKKGNSDCDNNFECSSNVCVSGKCISEGFIKRILKWFTSMFGGE